MLIKKSSMVIIKHKNLSYEYSMFYSTIIVQRQQLMRSDSFSPLSIIERLFNRPLSVFPLRVLCFLLFSFDQINPQYLIFAYVLLLIILSSSESCFKSRLLFPCFYIFYHCLYLSEEMVGKAWFKATVNVFELSVSTSGLWMQKAVFSSAK